MENRLQAKMKVRNVSFDFTEIKENLYVRNNSFSTHFTNSLHVLFPIGEMFFIKSVKRYMSFIEEPKLKKEMIDFMGQEGIHYREHERFWDQLLVLGIDAKPFAKFVDSTIQFFEKIFYFFLTKKFGDKLSLSITTGMEHYTALFGNQNLGNRDYKQDFFSKEMEMLMLWHSAEELEHKAVAFDVLQKVDQSYILRIVGFILASSFFYIMGFGGMFYFIWKDKKRNLSKPFTQLKEFLKNFGAKPQDAKGWQLMLDYFKRDFHPDQHDNYYLAEDFFNENKKYFEEHAYVASII
ncbi:MAG: putative metal-dependent hydrolase [Planctomycetota bacterium]|jgi:predicted metal-dependent hydrolase